MVSAALRDGTADRRCVFEVFARRLPPGRRYGVVAGTGRLIELIARLPVRRRRGRLPAPDRGRRRDRPRPGWPTTASPATSTGTPRASCSSPARRSSPSPARSPSAWCWRRWSLSVLNHDCAVAAAAARMVTAARGRPLIEMGSRRTHEEAAVAAARAAYLAGFASTSNLAAGRALRHPDRRHRRARVHAAARRRAGGVRLAGRRAGQGHHAAGRHVRHQPGHPQRDRGGRAGPAGDPDRLRRPVGARRSSPASCSTRSAPPRPKIIVSGDLDEYAIAALAAEPVDVYGAGTAVVTGSGAPTAGLVYKLVEVDGPAGGEALGEQGHRRRPQDRGPPAQADRHRHRGDRRLRRACPTAQPNDRLLQQPFVRRRRAGADLPTLAESREHLRQCLISIPWEGLKLSAGDPAIPVTVVTEPT